MMAAMAADRRIAADVHVALLRGINVGGKNKLAMKDLVAMFTSAGCTDVRHYIQSGNIVLRADRATAKNLPAQISRRIREAHGLSVPIVTRTGRELASVVAGNPFLAEGIDPSKLHVAFLADAPSRKALSGLDGDRCAPDAFAIRKREIYLYLPGGMARTKLNNAYFDRQLSTISTARNWRTTLELLRLATELSR